ncbi:MAG: NfeD family protein [Candidatus Bipolaricaulota bacterium]
MTLWRGCVIVLGLCALLTAAAHAETVWVLDVREEIGRGKVSYLRAGIAEAEEAGAAAVVLDFFTPGGYLDAASAARDVIMAAPLTTIAYVNGEALSAGALLALACEQIYFVSGGVMGAATPVFFDGTTMEEAPEKVVSAVRALFRSTAEARGRQPEIAEAMVDPTKAVEGLVEQGELLTLTASEAVEWGYSEGEAASLEALLELAGLEGATVEPYTARWTDRALEFLTSPWVAGLLITVGMLGLITELVTPGLGVPGVLGTACLGLFLWAHFLVGIAGWESLLFFLGGVIAVILELLVFTGSDFGFSGVGGLVLIGMGFYTAMVGPLTRPDEALWAVGAVSVSLVAALIGFALLVTRLPKSRLRFGGVILSGKVTGRAYDTEPQSTTEKLWLGKAGVAVTDLRPVGVARIDRERIDVVCEEGYLPKGTPVVVVRDEGYRKVVRRSDAAERPLEVTG